jgi:hypothetical protein
MWKQCFWEKTIFFVKNVLLLKFDGLFMAYGVILRHLEVDKITWGGVIFFKKRR